jgi:hypothetical protein
MLGLRESLPFPDVIERRAIGSSCVCRLTCGLNGSQYCPNMKLLYKTYNHLGPKGELVNVELIVLCSNQVDPAWAASMQPTTEPRVEFSIFPCEVQSR